MSKKQPQKQQTKSILSKYQVTQKERVTKNANITLNQKITKNSALNGLTKQSYIDEFSSKNPFEKFPNSVRNSQEINMENGMYKNSKSKVDNADLLQTFFSTSGRNNPNLKQKNQSLKSPIVLFQSLHQPMSSKTKNVKLDDVENSWNLFEDDINEFISIEDKDKMMANKSKDDHKPKLAFIHNLKEEKKEPTSKTNQPFTYSRTKKGLNPKVYSSSKERKSMSVKVKKENIEKSSIGGNRSSSIKSRESQRNSISRSSISSSYLSPKFSTFKKQQNSNSQKKVSKLSLETQNSNKNGSKNNIKRMTSWEKKSIFDSLIPQQQVCKINQQSIYMFINYQDSKKRESDRQDELNLRRLSNQQFSNLESWRRQTEQFRNKNGEYRS